MHRIGRVRLYIIIALTLLLEITFTDLITIGDIRPDPMLILLVYISLHTDWKETQEAALAAGLLRGISGTGSVAADIIIFSLCGAVGSYCRDKVFRKNPLTQIILTLLIAVIFNLSVLFNQIIIKDVKGIAADIWQMCARRTISLSLYTSALAPFLFFFLSKLFRIKESEF